MLRKKRKGGDSEREGFEPPYPSGYSGFQDHRHRPLGHLSILEWRGPLHPAKRPPLRFRSVPVATRAPSTNHLTCHPIASAKAAAPRQATSSTLSAPFRSRLVLLQPATWLATPIALARRSLRLAAFARFRSAPAALSLLSQEPAPLPRVALAKAGKNNYRIRVPWSMEHGTASPSVTARTSFTPRLARGDPERSRRVRNPTESEGSSRE